MGARVGRYLLDSKLGEGAMGEVWKARDPELGRWVAVKLLKGRDPEEIARFRREAQTAAQLSHPHIAAVYEATDEFIAMQYIEGRTLDDLPRGDARPLVELLRQAAEAVHFAHGRGIVHRDLKPANIMAQGSHAYVMDFGLARPMSVDSRISQSGMIVGTPSYMSPEQARGEKADPRSDVYSLGATLYELLAGAPPFVGQDVYRLLQRIVEHDAPPPPGERDLVPIVMKCLEKDPGRRYGDAAGLADDLGRWLRGEAILARPPSVAYRLRKILARHKGLVAIAGAGLLAVALVAAILVPRWLAERRARERAEREKAQELAALNELGALWLEIVLTKQSLYRAGEDPARARAALEDSLRRVTAFVERNPSMPQGWYVRARGRFCLEDYPGAAGDTGEALRLAPDFAPGDALLGRIALEEYEECVRDRFLYSPEEKAQAAPILERAAGHLRRAFARDADPFSSARWGLPATREDRVADALVRAGMAWAVERDIARAFGILREAQERDPCEECLLWLSRFAPSEPERLRFLDRAAEIAPNHPRVRLDRGIVLSEQGRLDEGLRDLNRAVELRPGWAHPYNSRGAARMTKGDTVGALEDYTRAIELNPRSAYAYVNRAAALRVLGRLDAALADCDRALQLSPRLIHAHFNRGIILTALKRPDEALQAYDRAIDLDDRFTDALVNRGILHRERGNLDAALLDFTRAVEAAPRDPAAWGLRGELFAARGDHRSAEQDFTRALGLEPDNLVSRENRGRSRHRLGDIPGARQDYDRLVELDPKNPSAWWGRASCRSAVGDSAGALRDLEKANELAPPDWPLRPQLEEILRKLRGG